MNLSLNFTMRDKILLAVLAVVLFVGMMYLYGVMPANEEAEQLAKQAAEKQQQLNALNAQIAGINIDALEEEYDILLDYYYDAKAEIEAEGEDATLPDRVQIVAIERRVIGMLDDAGIEGYSTQGWAIAEETFVREYNGYEANYSIARAVCPTPFRCDPDKVGAFIDRVAEEEFFTLTDISISYTTENVTVEDGTAGEDGQEPVTETREIAEGSLTLEYYMIARDVTAAVPALLPEVTGLEADGATISFDSVENAEGYEFYTRGADGNFTLVPSLAVSATADGRVTVKLSDAYLTPGTHEIAVRAVGDKMAAGGGWFKSPKPGADTAVVTVTI